MVNALRGVSGHLIATDPLTRRLSMQSLLFSAGGGAFVTGSAVFFTQVVGLSVVQVGLGYAIDGAAVLAATRRLGRIADKVGPKRAWATAAMLEGLVFLCYPLAGNFLTFICFMAIIGLLSAAAGSARTGYIFALKARKERVLAQAYLRTAYNAGQALGALLGSAALLSRATAWMSAVPILTGVLMIGNGLFVSRLPAVPRQSEPYGSTVQDESDDEVLGRGRRGFGWRYFLLSAGNGILTAHQTILVVVLPLWAVTSTPAPRPLLGTFFLINTFLAIATQVRISRNITGVGSAVRADVRAAFLLAVSCLLFLTARWGNIWTSVSVLLIGCVILTIAEVLQSAGSWGLVSELAPADRVSEFQGLFQQGSSLESVFGPAAFTYVVVAWGAVGWASVIALLLSAAWIVSRCARAINSSTKADTEDDTTTNDSYAVPNSA